MTSPHSLVLLSYFLFSQVLFFFLECICLLFRLFSFLLSRSFISIFSFSIWHSLMCQQSDDDRGYIAKGSRKSEASWPGGGPASCWLSSSLRDFFFFPSTVSLDWRSDCSLYTFVSCFLPPYTAALFFLLFQLTIYLFSFLLLFFIPFFFLLSTLFRTQREIHRLFRIRPSIIIRRRVNTQTHTQPDCTYTHRIVYIR